MPPAVEKDDIRVSGNAPEPEPEDTQSSKPIIGIIYPPPEVRNIVDKTASFVGRNGPEFEARIRQNEINNSKFNFLNNNDPYHAYYRHKVKEFIEGKGKEPSVPKSVPSTVKPSVAVVQEQFVPKDPPANYEFIADPPSIAAYDLDVVRLTAQFVARNGRTFLTQLMQREAKNFQFDFLRPQHSLFQYFTKLCEQYSKILIPPKTTLEKLKKEGDNPKIVLDEVKYRVAWTKHEERIRQRQQAAIEKERLMYAQIDWHDFVVVETVDFQMDERGNFPRPVTIDELGTRLLQQERIDKFGEDAMKQHEEENKEKEEEEEIDEHPQLVDMDMEESSDEEEEEVAPSRTPRIQPAPPIKPPSHEVIIRKNYDPKTRQEKKKEKVKQPVPDSYMVSPITGEKIHSSKMQEHMRIGLLDPNWKEQKRKQILERQQEEEVFAAGGDIEASLKGLAERRTDIFGVEETGIGQKVGEEEDPQEEKVSWDGHSSSASNTREKAKANVTIEEQLEHIQRAQGMLVDEKLEKIGPKPTEPNDTPKSTPQPVPVPVPERPPVTQVPVQPVQPQTQQPHILAPVMVRPVIQMQQQPNPVLVVQQQMPMVRQPQPQLIAVQRPQMMVQTNIVHQPRMLQPMQLHHQQHMMDGPPQAKRARTEADLIPANIFLQQNSGPAQFRVQCPNLPDKSEWKLQGQMLTFALPLTDEVSVIKAKIHEATGMPAGKQKLQLDGLFIKDSNSLAFYNVTGRSVIVLQVKERGGRKK